MNTSAQWRERRRLLVARSVTVAPRMSTVMRLASRSASRSSACSMRVPMPAGVVRGRSVISLRTPITPINERTAFSDLMRSASYRPRR
jgi:hypothetical protein